MMGFRRSTCICAVLLPFGAATALSAAAAAEPEGVWELEKTAEQCTLQRKLSAPQPGALSFTTEPGSDSYRLTIAAATLPKAPAGVFQAAVILHDSEKRVAGSGMSGQLGGAFPAAYQISGIDAAELAAFTRATSLSVSMKTGTVGPFAFPEAADAIAAFEECTSEHLVAMGADPKQFQPGGTKPVATRPRETWLTFPQMMEVGKARGRDMAPAKFKLLIDARGKVESCSRLGAAAGDPVEKVACAALASGASFRPAKDPAGNPVRGIATYTIMPFGPPGALARR